MIERDFLRAIAADPTDKVRYLVYADWLEEKGRGKEAAGVREDVRMPKRWDAEIPKLVDAITLEPLRSYDWKEAFAYAGEPESCRNPQVTPALPNDDISLTPFCRADVEAIIAQDEGKRDGRNWLCAGKLLDGRYFFLSAGCDYTGWD